MTRRYRDQMTRAYGIFPPHSAMRDFRNLNASEGRMTCHCCGNPFEPEAAVARLYCSESCARKDSPAYARMHPSMRPTVDGFSLDLRECECAK